MNDNLKEGKKYNFKVIKKSDFPDGNEYFILQDPFENKHLLNAKYYFDYNIRVNSNIVCKVDKINCTGKIFLEPEHPYYKIGEIYDFDFVKFIIHQTNDTNNENFAIVNDINNNEINLILNNYVKQIHKPKSIKCKVERIKKAKIFLTPIDSEFSCTNLIEGKNYKFEVFDISKMADNKYYYLLKDPFNNKHILDKLYYKDYGIEKGQFINCNVVRISSESFYYIEPEHPYYKIGEVYKFKFLDVQSIDNKNIVVVKDVFENKIFIENNKFNTSDKIPKYINCKVSKIKKGKLFIEIND